MPTQKREWYPYASYHIAARGNHRNDIFKDKEDFVYYLTLIKEMVDYYIYDKYEIISYCLFRVAISNNRIMAFENGYVVFLNTSELLLKLTGIDINLIVFAPWHSFYNLFLKLSNFSS